MYPKNFSVRVGIHWFAIGSFWGPLSGCTTPPNGAITEPNGADTEPIVAAVKAVYEQEQRRSTLYFGSLEASAAETSESELLDKIALELQVKVLPLSAATYTDGENFPLIDPDDGSPAVAIIATVGRAVELTSASYQVPVEMISESGNERLCQDVIVRRSGGAWRFDQFQTPGCDCLPIEVHSQAVARVREGPCCGLWSSLGTCVTGDIEWNVVLECAGYGGTWSYYHTESGLLVRRYTTTDTEPFILDDCGPDAFTECDFSEDQKIVCLSDPAIEA